MENKSLGDIIREKKAAKRLELSNPVEPKKVVEEPVAVEEKKSKWTFNGMTIEGLE